MKTVMDTRLTVYDEIQIEAAPSKVWEILTNPKFVAQWDELPEGYPTENMKVGSKVIWDLPNGGQSITTIIHAEKERELKIVLNVTNWEIKPHEGEVAYLYQLEERTGSTLLKLTIGDFSLIKDGQVYYDASVEFAANSKKVIKQLAESLNDK
jgi:uncharacterized protein YndB with AHSA1/START domain